MAGLILLRPWWLLGLLLAAGLAIRAVRRDGDAGGWDQVMPAPTLAAMRALGALTGGGSGWRRLWPVAGLACLCLGLAGPAMPRRDAPAFEQTDAILIALDMSPSIAQGPGLGRAQIAAAGLMQAVAGRPVGLILFGGEAYQVAAPTADVATLESQIAVLAPGLLPGKGSRPAAALGLAGQMLDGMKRADLVVISDGGGVDALAEAEADRLAAQGVRVSTLLVQDAAPGAPPARPDALARLARDGPSLMAGDVDRLAARLAHVADPGGDAAMTALQYRDFGPLIAALGLVPLLMLLRRPA